MATMPAKVLFKFYSKERRLLHVGKSSNFQFLISKEWWPFVEFIAVKHFDSYDDLENAKSDAIEVMERQPIE